MNTLLSVSVFLIPLFIVIAFIASKKKKKFKIVKWGIGIILILWVLLVFVWNISGLYIIRNFYKHLESETVDQIIEDHSVDHIYAWIVPILIFLYLCVMEFVFNKKSSDEKSAE